MEYLKSVLNLQKERKEQSLGARGALSCGQMEGPAVPARTVGRGAVALTMHGGPEARAVGRDAVVLTVPLTAHCQMRCRVMQVFPAGGPQAPRCSLMRAAEGCLRAAEGCLRAVEGCRSLHRAQPLQSLRGCLRRRPPSCTAPEASPVLS